MRSIRYFDQMEALLSTSSETYQKKSTVEHRELIINMVRNKHK
jgi:hypothetical protein